MQVIELEISRFPYKERPYMPGSQTTQGRLDTCAGVSDHVAFHESYRVSTLENHLRGSMAGLHAPLSTLRRTPHGMLRMTRGQCGSLHLHRNGLAPTYFLPVSRRTT